MFKLNDIDMAKIDVKLQQAKHTTEIVALQASGCPNCNGQCKNGCGVTCVAILS